MSKLQSLFYYIFYYENINICTKTNASKLVKNLFPMIYIISSDLIDLFKAMERQGIVYAKELFDAIINYACASPIMTQ